MVIDCAAFTLDEDRVMTPDDHEIAQDAYLRRGRETVSDNDLDSAAERALEYAIKHLLDCVKDKNQVTTIAIAASISNVALALLVIYQIYRHG